MKRRVGLDRPRTCVTRMSGSLRMHWYTLCQEPIRKAATVSPLNVAEKVSLHR